MRKRERESGRVWGGWTEVMDVDDEVVAEDGESPLWPSCPPRAVRQAGKQALSNCATSEQPPEQPPPPLPPVGALGASGASRGLGPAGVPQATARRDWDGQGPGPLGTGPRSVELCRYRLQLHRRSTKYEWILIRDSNRRLPFVKHGGTPSSVQLRHTYSYEVRESQHHRQHLETPSSNAPQCPSRHVQLRDAPAGSATPEPAWRPQQLNPIGISWRPEGAGWRKTPEPDPAIQPSKDPRMTRPGWHHTFG